MYHIERYKRNPVVDFPERTWPNKQIEKAPIWCSVDLRDGNQALVEPMVVEEKMEFFELLLKLGFKEIEIGFPAASQIEYDFLRQLADRKMIPEDVHVQILCQCREHLINRSFEAIEGIAHPIMHIYNSTNTLQRDVVFNASKEEVKQIAINGVILVISRDSSRILSQAKGCRKLNISIVGLLASYIIRNLDLHDLVCSKLNRLRSDVEVIFFGRIAISYIISGLTKLERYIRFGYLDRIDLNGEADILAIHTTICCLVVHGSSNYIGTCIVEGEGIDCGLIICRNLIFFINYAFKLSTFTCLFGRK